MDDMFSSLKSSIFYRLKSPLLLTILIVNILYHFDLVLYVFSNVNVLEKISYIEKYIENNSAEIFGFKIYFFSFSFLNPFLYSFVIILFYPALNILSVMYTSWIRTYTVNIQKRNEYKELLSPEESQEWRISLENAKRRYSNDIEYKDIQLRDKEKQITDLISKNENQLKEIDSLRISESDLKNKINLLEADLEKNLNEKKDIKEYNGKLSSEIEELNNKLINVDELKIKSDRIEKIYNALNKIRNDEIFNDSDVDEKIGKDIFEQIDNPFKEYMVYWKNLGLVNGKQRKKLMLTEKAKNFIDIYHKLTTL